MESFGSESTIYRLFIELSDASIFLKSSLPSLNRATALVYGYSRCIKFYLNWRSCVLKSVAFLERPLTLSSRLHYRFQEEACAVIASTEQTVCRVHSGEVLLRSRAFTLVLSIAALICSVKFHKKNKTGPVKLIITYLA